MAEVSLEKRFRGSVRLVTLHLWRVGKSTNIDACIEEALALKMIKPENEQFIRKCLASDELLAAGEDPNLDITAELVQELQMCAIRLNAADPA